MNSFRSAASRRLSSLLPIDEHVDAERFPQDAVVCPMWKNGQEFIIEGSWPERPAGFRDWAWSDIQRDVAMILPGADLPWQKRRQRISFRNLPGPLGLGPGRPAPTDCTL